MTRPGCHCGSIVLVAIWAFCISCGGGGDSQPQSFQFDFANGAEQFVAGSSHYPVAWEPQMGIESGIRFLPAPLDTSRTGFYEKGDNLSDDLFLYMKRQISGLKPSTDYAITFRATFATNALEVGGSSFYLKAGATATEPDRVVATVNSMPYYVMNVDTGPPAGNAKDVVLLGNLVKPTPSNPNWELKTLSNASAFVARTDSSGSLWLLFGVDSAFEVRTDLYYTAIRVEATARQ